MGVEDGRLFFSQSPEWRYNSLESSGSKLWCRLRDIGKAGCRLIVTVLQQVFAMAPHLSAEEQDLVFSACTSGKSAVEICAHDERHNGRQALTARQETLASQNRATRPEAHLTTQERPCPGRCQQDVSGGKHIARK